MPSRPQIDPYMQGMTDALCCAFGNPFRGYKYYYNPEELSITVTYNDVQIWWGKFHKNDNDGYSEDEIKQYIALRFMDEMRKCYTDKVLEDAK